MPMVKATPTVLLFLLCISACGDDGNADTDGQADAAPITDAMPNNVCTILESAYADLGMVTGVATLRPVDLDRPDEAHVLSLQIPLNQDASPDVLFIELWGDAAPFEAGFTAKTITLTGVQGDLITCGACAYIAPDHVEGSNIAFHMASSGQLLLNVLDATAETGQVSGVLTGLKVREVTVDTSGQHVVEGGCKTTLEKVQFDFGVSALQGE